MDEHTPWYKRKVGRRHQLMMAFVWIPGVILALLTDSLALRLAGLGLIFFGLAIQLYALVRAEDA